LREDCERLQLSHDIVELTARPGSTWIEICRKKIPFIAQAYRRHGRPIFWLDADTRLLKRPRILDHSAGFDFAAFLRGIRYLRGFEASLLPRMFAPFALYFNSTPAAGEFIDLLANLEQSYASDATDDYFLQEAWVHHKKQLAVLILPPAIVAREWPPEPEHELHVGISGNVRGAIRQAAQHEAPQIHPLQVKAAFSKRAAAALAEEPSDALVLWRHALEVGGPDDSLALKVTRLTARLKGPEAALDFLKAYRCEDPAARLAERYTAEENAKQGHYAVALSGARLLLDSPAAADRQWAGRFLLRNSLSAPDQSGRKVGVEPALWWPGDTFSPSCGNWAAVYLLAKLSHLPPRWAEEGKGLHIGGVSVAAAKHGSEVWCGGMATPHDGVDPSVVFHAVRGPLSYKRIIDLGGQCPPCFGDPMWLLPTVYTPRRPARKQALALISDDDPATLGHLGVPIVSTRRNSFQELERFIDEIACFDSVVSTSLHGLIACHAYGIACRWVRIEGSPYPEAFPFVDYLLSVGVDEPDIVPLQFDAAAAGSSAHLGQLPVRPIDVDALLASAPFQLARSPSTTKPAVLPAWLRRR
jgi:hypothetical protein